MLKKYDQFFNFSHQLFDFLVVVFIGVLFFHSYASIHKIIFAYLIPSSLIFIFIFKSLQLYNSFREKELIAIAIKIFFGTAIWMLCLNGFFWFAGAPLNSHIVHYWVISVAAYFIIKQVFLMFLARWFRSKGYNIKYVLLIGEDYLMAKVISELQKHSKLGYQIVKIIPAKEALIAETISSIEFDQVWIAYSLDHFAQVRNIIAFFRYSPKEIRLITDISDSGLINQSVSQIGLLPIINIRSTPMSESSSRLIKAIEDRLLSIIILLLASPLMLIIALFVKFSSQGPILFKQKRHGINGVIFNVYKFRTMYSYENNNTFSQAKKNDIRVTKVGCLLRKLSLDELPQFFNVLFGSMSIVGPRPHAIPHNEYYANRIKGYMLRHMVKSGITGLAQINGCRCETKTIKKMKKRVDYDLHYIQHWSLWLDIKIIFLTIFKGFFNKN